MNDGVSWEVHRELGMNACVDSRVRQSQRGKREVIRFIRRMKARVAHLRVSALSDGYRSRMIKAA
jgi:hypothetical protein